MKILLLILSFIGYVIAVATIFYLCCMIAGDNTEDENKQ